MLQAQFFDGVTAYRHEVCISVLDDQQALVIHADSLAEPVRWELSDLRALSDSSSTAQLTLTRYTSSVDERDPARLIVTDSDFIAGLRATQPDLFRRDVRKRTWLRMAGWGAGAVGAIALMLFVILPGMANILAEAIPIEREVAFGKAVTQQIEWVLSSSSASTQRCDSPKGIAALNTMLERLTAGRDMHYEIAVQVFEHPGVNAFAAPGGQVVILSALLEKAETPEEVAGVLAHEIGHVERRDPMRQALRAAGAAGLLSMVFGDLAGAALVSEHLLTAAYSREAEVEADRFALDMLAAAQVDVAGFANFFARIEELEAGDIAIPERLSTHPDSNWRGAQAQHFAESQGETTAVLTSTEWAALQAICD
ncbi:MULTISPECIES: M48 family metallopeptidase [unclassified Halomonas]|uniref:M48 family metallopeptidase n=1 Tax=unclassified Halomonas TaxID=2609666 RepID=UPI0007D9F33E|nr:MULTISPECIES: M48 family metallopeptidase [unclassified Halomonas]MBT2785771.1 M48 family metallopeptidase [Halomonas sp. ISL-106]MBT2798825.1 M48 family metallopeptidase [Halomonas sp. ISL-104]OAL59187.1 peptidase M48 [Halomonas sp. ALS9]